MIETNAFSISMHMCLEEAFAKSKISKMQDSHLLLNSITIHIGLKWSQESHDTKYDRAVVLNLRFLSEVVAFCWNSLLSDVFKNGKASEKLSTSSWLASSWHPLLNEANKQTKIRTFIVPKTTTQTKGSSRPERLQLCCFHAWFPSNVSSSSPQANTATLVVVEHY